MGILVTLRICWAVYFTQDHKSGKSDKAPGKPMHQPRLVRVHQTFGFVPRFSVIQDTSARITKVARVGMCWASLHTGPVWCV